MTITWPNFLLVGSPTSGTFAEAWGIFAHNTDQYGMMNDVELLVRNYDYAVLYDVHLTVCVCVRAWIVIIEWYC